MKNKTSEQKYQELIAEALVNQPEAMAANTIAALYNNTVIHEGVTGISTLTTMDELKKATEEVKNGDLSNIEGILVNQIHVLNQWFLRYIQLGFNNHGQAEFDRVLGMYHFALKTQEQARKTAATLGAIKAPRQTAFIKTLHQTQTTINQTPEENFTNRTNELLGVNAYVNRMDTGTAQTASRINTEMAAVGTLHRS